MSQEPLQPELSDEIDIGELVLAIWDGKWLIAGVAAAVLALGIVVAYFVPNKYSATLLVDTISRVQLSAYDELNRLDFFNIDGDILRSRLMEKLTKEDTLKSEFEKVGYLNRADFSNDNEYELDLARLVNDVDLIAPLRDDEFAKDRKAVRRENNWTITFEGTQKNKYLTVLQNSLDLAQERVRQDLIDEFNAKVDLTKSSARLSIVDLDRAIQNANEDYDKSTARRLAFLSEQGSIARKLGVQGPTSNLLTALESTVEQPFYMRGYDAIEQEIELLSTRKDKSLFIPGLVELETKKRLIFQNPLLQRAQAAFEKTPIFTNDGFAAAQFDVNATKFTASNRRLMLIAVSGFLGLMAGLFVLMLRNVLRSRKSAA